MHATHNVRIHVTLCAVNEGDRNNLSEPRSGIEISDCYLTLIIKGQLSEGRLALVQDYQIICSFSFVYFG